MYKHRNIVWRLLLQEDGYSYLENTSATSHVIIVHSQDLAFYEELA